MTSSHSKHARCHRDFAQSTNDFIIGDVSLIEKAGYDAASTSPHGDGKQKFNVFSLRGKVRGMDVAEGNWRWYHGGVNSGWHAGFDVNETTLVLLNPNLSSAV